MKRNKIINKESEKFLEHYINNPSPTGFESEGQKLWLDYIKPYIDTHIVDTYGTVVGIINPEAKYKVVIEAHADEISWFVHYITKEGFIYLRRNGGSDHQIAPSKRVNIHAKKGTVKAVFGWPAIHTRKNGDEKAPKLDNIFLDCGCSSKDEVEKLLEYCGLEWDQKCLNFYKQKNIVSTASVAQVRSPIYKSSVKSWQNHSENLKKLKDFLGE